VSTNILEVSIDKPDKTKWKDKPAVDTTLKFPKLLKKVRSSLKSQNPNRSLGIFLSVKKSL
jgi:hypothetical protein